MPVLFSVKQDTPDRWQRKQKLEEICIVLAQNSTDLGAVGTEGLDMRDPRLAPDSNSVIAQIVSAVSQTLTDAEALIIAANSTYGVPHLPTFIDIGFGRNGRCRVGTHWRSRT